MVIWASSTVPFNVANVKAGNSYWKGRISTVDLSVLTSLNRLLLIMQTLLTIFYKTSYLNEVNYYIGTWYFEISQMLCRLTYFWSPSFRQCLVCVRSNLPFRLFKNLPDWGFLSSSSWCPDAWGVRVWNFLFVVWPRPSCVGRSLSENFSFFN
jgi:hypothetical protein